MSAILKTIHEFDKCMGARGAFRIYVPVQILFAVFIGMPICVLAAVCFFTIMLTVPIVLIFARL